LRLFDAAAQEKAPFDSSQLDFRPYAGGYALAVAIALVAAVGLLAFTELSEIFWIDLATMGNVLIDALILARTGGDELALSGVQAILSAGAVIGGILISAWGGPGRKVRGALISMALCAILGRLGLGLGRDFVIWIPGAFFVFFFIPILNGCLAPVWLSKVPPDVQGRVMSARITLSRAMIPLGTLIAGPLAERLFEPAMLTGGRLTPLFGNLIGTGPGADISLLFILTGVLMLGLAPLGLAVPAIRDAETLLPDYAVTVVQD
jgi:DHA3 family macrolide efflux protein-like MFS transporter